MERREGAKGAVFALDVGTRKVAGLWVAKDAGGARVLAHALREHPERAMIDGQVHLIDKAALVVAQVKADLEKLTGEKLSEAHVAVAGRALMTAEHSVSLKTGSTAPLERGQVLMMELAAVKEAKSRLKDPRAAAGSYCVGYTVTRWALDGQAMLALEGHSGEDVEISVLATFLPKVVLDSLNAVLRQAGLSLASLTLEPIAAVSIAVPPDMRRLNIAMVDVGAGTSDIALTKDGRVAAFAMAPVAGDEITERLAEAFLLDFSQAETLKKADPASIGCLVTDVFGNKRVLGPAEVWEQAQPAITTWAVEVAGRILEMNQGKAPQAVLLVGGGSQSPGMDAALAEALGVPPARVGKRPTAMQKEFENLPEAFKGAWATTPLGIALSAIERRGLPFAQFRVNEQRVQVLNLNQAFSAFDALVAAGKELSEFYSRPGLALTYEFNGAPRAEKGSLGSGAKLFVNGAAAAVDSHIKPGDALVFLPAVAGADARLSLSQALEREGAKGLRYSLNGQAREFPVEITLDGATPQGDPELRDRAKIKASFEAPLEKLLKAEGVDLSGLISRSIAVTVNGEPRVVTQRNYRLLVNGAEASAEARVSENDVVEFDPSVSFQERVRDLISRPLPKPRIKVKLNGEWTEVEGSPAKLSMNGREVSADEFLIDGAEIKVLEAARQVSVIELLAQLPFDSARLKASHFELRVNGAATPFSATLNEGDEIELKFDSAPGARTPG